MMGGTSVLPGVSVVILNWNGAELLEECLPGIIEAASGYPAECQVLVADNGSTDTSLDVLRASFPSVDVLAFAENRGFGKGCNDGVAGAKHPVVVLLNNDVAVEPDFIEPLVELLIEPDTFAVMPRMGHWDRQRPFCSAIAGELRHGRFVQRWALDSVHGDLCDEVTPTLYASGAAMAFRKEVFHDLGGFDPIYHPFYWEDTDLAYRAWKRGLMSWYQPRSRVYHKVGASMEKGTVGRTHLMRRNRYLFHWRNLTDRGALLAHLATLPWEVLRSSWVGSRDHGAPWPRELGLEVKALLSALPRLGQVSAGRRLDRRHQRLTDAEVLSRSDWRGAVPNARAQGVCYR